MWLVWIAVGVCWAAGNALVTWRVWRSRTYERGQQIAQTLLIWLIPASALFVNFVMAQEGPRARAQDPTASHGPGPEIEWDVLQERDVPHHEP